jgi:hypothetical protein
MAIYIEIITFILFFLLLKSIIERCADTESLLVILIIFITTIGEYLNLFVYRATAYTGRTGVPVYIILGGVLIGWSFFKLPSLIAKKIQQNRILTQITIFSTMTIIFPLIEIAGIETGLWHWLKPHSFSSIWWWIGVWKFYFIFLGIPVLILIIINQLKSHN